MNKLLTLPLTLMLMISIYIGMMTSVEPEGSTGDYSDSSGITLTQESGTNTTAHVNIPEASSQTFDIWNAETGILIIVGIALAVGIVAGIKVLGSGLDDLSHRMIFNAMFFLSLWTCLTIVSRDLMFENWVTGFLWMGLTLMFSLGLIGIINGEGVSE